MAEDRSVIFAIRYKDVELAPCYITVHLQAVCLVRFLVKGSEDIIITGKCEITHIDFKLIKFSVSFLEGIIIDHVIIVISKG